MNFTFDSLVQARASVERLQSCFDRLREAAESATSSAHDVDALAAPHIAEFDAALDADLNMSLALSAVFRFTTAINQAAPTGAAAVRASEVLLGFDAILDVVDRRLRTGLVSKATLEARADTIATDATLPSGPLGASAIEDALAVRHALKRARNFRAADAVRDELKQRGVTVEDTPSGVRWRLCD
jgi:cysteinyl-tRNA synthetase